MLKKLFGGREPADHEYSIDDLFVLERYDEAEAKLLRRLKEHPKDLRSHLKLAEVYLQQQQVKKAVDQYVFVAEEYAADGFFDKGVALLGKVQRLVPMDDQLPLKIERIRQRKRLERVREAALAGLREGMDDSDRTGTSMLELEGLWGQLVRSSVVRQLDGEQLHRLFAAMDLERYEADHTLAERGALEPRLLLIVRGQIEARALSADGDETALRLFGTGDIVGESTIFEQRPWPARFVTVEPVTLLALDRPMLERLLQGNPDPRRLIDSLRDQHADRDIEAMVAKLGL